MKYVEVIAKSTLQEQYPLDPKQVAFFKQRQQRHESLVKKSANRIAKRFKGVARKLLSVVKQHDASKWGPEEYYYYVWLTANKNLGCKYPSKELERAIDKAWEHHYMNNPHHPEYWVKRYGLQKMPSHEIAHMVADWAAMSAEFHNSLRQWWKNNAKKKFRFSEQQQKFIEALIDTFPELG